MSTYQNIKTVAREVKEIGGAIAVVLVVFLLGTLSIHWMGWLRGGDHIQSEIQRATTSMANAADTSNDSSTEMLNAVGTVNHQLLPQLKSTLEDFGKMVRSGTTLLNTTNGAVGNANDKVVLLAPKVTKAFDDLDTQIAEIGKGAAGVFGSTKTAIDEIPKTLQSAQGTLNAGTLFLNGPLTNNSNDAGKILKPFGLFVSDAQFKAHQLMFGEGCPVDQQHCPKKPITNWEKTYRIIRGASPVAQPLYYGTKLFFEFGK